MFKHDFPWGTALKAALLNGDTERDEKYRDCFYENFEYAVLENALKWRQMEANRVSRMLRMKKVSCGKHEVEVR